MKVLPECVVNFAQLRRVSQLGQVTSKHQSGLTWGPPPSPWPLSKNFINFFSKLHSETFFCASVFHTHSSNVKSLFSLIPYNGPFQIVATLVLWSMYSSLLEKPFLEWLDPAISWESFSSKSGTEHRDQLWSCKRRNATKLFVLWQRVFHNQFDLPNKRIRLSKWFDERCLIEKQWGIEKVNTCVQ